MENSLVSIIIPTFNSEKYIEETINSILGQTYTKWEAIIVDDGSTDSTSSIIQKYKFKDHRIKSVPNKGNGVADARNTGLDVAQGDFITFLDSDDIFYPLSIEKRVVKLVLNPEINLVYCSAEIINESSVELGWSLGLRDKINYYDNMYGNPIHIISLMGRRKSIKKIKFKTGLTNGEDWLFIATLLRSGEIIYKVEDCKVAYRMHTESTVGKKYINHEYNLFNVIDWIYSSIPKSSIAIEPYTEGIMYPDKQVVFTKRYARIITWILLTEDLEEYLKIKFNLSDDAFKNITYNEAINEIRNAAKRFYVCGEMQLNKKLVAEKKRLITFIKKNNIHFDYPVFIKAFQAVLDGILTYKLPKAAQKKNRKYIIYGTGIIATQYMHQYESRNMESFVDLFIDSKPSMLIFMNKPVYSVREFGELMPRYKKHFVIIASKAAEKSMYENLIAIGVSPDKIIIAQESYSAKLYWPRNRRKISTVFLYPSILEDEQRNKIYNTIKRYIPNILDLNIKQNVNMVTEADFQKNDLFIVWKSECLNEDLVKKYASKVICIDSENRNIDFERFEFQNKSEELD